MIKHSVLSFCLLGVLVTSAFAAVVTPVDVGTTVNGLYVDLGLPTAFFTGLQTSWTAPAPIEIYDGPALVGVLNQFSISYKTDPYVTLAFAVTAYTNMDFDLTASVNANPTVTNALGQASATLTVISDDDGALLTGLINGQAYQATFNQGQHFVSMLDTVSVPENDFAGIAGDYGPASISQDVYQLAGHFKFNLTAGDQANGTSSFIVTPEPATMILLALGFGLAAKRRS